MSVAPFRRCLLLGVTALFIAAPRAARAESDGQVWGGLFLQAKLDPVVPRLAFWLDLQPRHGGAATTTLVRPGIGLRLIDGLVLHAGYAWIARWPDDGATTHEHRIWEQLLGNLSPEGTGFDLVGRVRLEQRFSAQGGSVAHRARVMARAGWWPDREGPILLVIWDEFFVGLSGAAWGPVSGFDQNRAFAGIGLKGLGPTRFELGYLNLYVHRDSGPDRDDHVASFNLFVTL